jgi:hypothetical protein
MSNGVRAIIRLNHDGSQDMNFNPGINSGIGDDVAELPGGEIIASGDLLTGTNLVQRKIVRLISTPLRIHGWNDSARELCFGGPFGSRFILEHSTDLSDWFPLLTNQFGPDPFHYLDPQPSPWAARFFRLRVPRQGE